jgi:alginate O-acetyltransferase complex protein AlgI
MLFNSLGFAFFFIIVFLFYSVLSSRYKLQNRLLLLASCIFYAFWDWRFLLLIFVLVTTDYICGLKIHRTKDTRVKKRFFFLSLFVSLSILGFFKYFNFFIGNLEALLNVFDLATHIPVLKILLPLGISFYIFKTMSYTLDVYNEVIEPTENYLDYALYVTFFPQLLAGPIARARDLLPQIITARQFKPDRFYEGCYLIFWGLFQKVFVADNLAKLANTVFDAPAPYNGLNVLFAMYAFAFQIYCDFAGYSNMAIGIGKCLGFETSTNFNLPYFATNPMDFWRRWHMTLSSWLRDYVYMPVVMGLRHMGKAGTVIAVLTTFLICGLWHGAEWKFVLWGSYWGIMVLLYALLQPSIKKIPIPKNGFAAGIWLTIQIIFFFHIICIGWLLFRANSLGQAGDMIGSLYTNLQFHETPGLVRTLAKLVLFAGSAWLMQFIQFLKKDHLYALKLPFPVRVAFYVVVLYMIVLFGVGDTHEFIYFQF